MILRILLTIAACTISVGFAQTLSGKPEPTKSCDAIISSLTEQADVASSVALPRVLLSPVLLQIGSAVDGCSFDLSKGLMLRAFEDARTLTVGGLVSSGADAKSGADAEIESSVRESRRRTLYSVIDWFVASAGKRKRPELVSVARELAGRINYAEDVIGRQQAFGPVFNALLQGRDNDPVQQLLAEIQVADGSAPTELFLSVLRADSGEALRANVFRLGYAAVETGQCGLPADLKFVEKASELQGRTQAVKALQDCIQHRKRPKASKQEDVLAIQRALALLLRLEPELRSEYPDAPMKQNQDAPKSSSDALANAYEEIQVLAEDSSAAVAIRIAQVQDGRMQQALLTSAESALLAAGKTEAAARVASVISSMPVPTNNDQHPVDVVMRARSTTSGDDMRVQVGHALAIAEKILAAENKAFSAASDEKQRIRLYSESSVEAVNAYLYAAESAFDLAFESAQRIIGPRRAEVLSMVLTVACERHVDNCMGVIASR